MLMNQIEISNRTISDQSPCYVIAEIGLNHNGDAVLAVETIAAAAEAGTDAVKFQNYRTEDFVSDRSLMYEYISQGKSVVESQFDLFKRCQLSPEDLATYSQTCRDHGVDFISTPTSMQGVEDLIAAGAAALKNGSDYLGHLPLIETMARSGLPTILSTGMATLGEIDRAVSAYHAAGGTRLVILHCVPPIQHRPRICISKRSRPWPRRLVYPLGSAIIRKGLLRRLLGSR